MQHLLVLGLATPTDHAELFCWHVADYLFTLTLADPVRLGLDKQNKFIRFCRDLNTYLETLI